MRDLNHEPAADTFEVEISDISADAADEPDKPQTPTRLAARARLSSRARAWRIALVASAFLALLVVILAGQPALRSQIVGVVASYIPTPTPTLAPGADRLYIAADVPWTTVTLDGQPIALPRIGIDAPLRLARGTHLLTWTAAPFQPQQCIITIPATAQFSCPIIDEAQRGTAGPAFRVIGLHESLDTLPAAQQQALIHAAQAALSGFSDTVQPGEPYLTLSGEPIPTVFGNGGSMQPLRAALQLQLDAEIPTQLCVLNLRSQETANCTISGQGCARFCSVPWQARQAETSAADRLAWLTFAVIDPPSWDYATEDGQVIAQNQPVGPGGFGGVATRETPVLLRIAWNGSAWQAQPLFGPDQGAPIFYSDAQVTDDPACLAAEDIFPGDATIYTRLRFISGPNPAAGCLVVATLITPDGTPTAAAPAEEYLMRFGEFLAVNHLAQQRYHQWPLADAYEQQLARQLAALPGGLSVTAT